MKKKVPDTQSCPLEYFCNQPNTDKLLSTDVPKNHLILINHTNVLVQPDLIHRTANILTLTHKAHDTDKHTS